MGFFDFLDETLGYFVDGFFWLVNAIFDIVEAVYDAVNDILDAIESFFTEEQIANGELTPGDGIFVNPDVAEIWLKNGVMKTGDPVKVKRRIKERKATVALVEKDGKILGSKLVGSEKGFDPAIKTAFDEGLSYKAPIQME